MRTTCSEAEENGNGVPGAARDRGTDAATVCRVIPIKLATRRKGICRADGSSAEQPIPRMRS